MPSPSTGDPFGQPGHPGPEDWSGPPPPAPPSGVQYPPGPPYGLPPGSGPYGPAAAYGPPSLPVTQRIPDDLPFVVRASARKRAVFFGLLGLALTLFVSGPPACLLGAAGAGAAPVHRWAAALALMGCTAALFAVVFVLSAWLVVSGGPVLAVGPQGLWIRTRPTRGQAIWLPWELIARVSRRRWAFDRYVCVTLRDRRVLGNLGGFTAFDSALPRLISRNGLIATANFADKTEDEIIGALWHFAAGRCPVG